MIVIMRPRSTAEHVKHIVKTLDELGVRSYTVNGAGRNIVEVLGANGELDITLLQNLPMVDRVIDHAGAMLAANREPDDRTREVPLSTKATVGGKKLAIIAGPCSVEDKGQLVEVACAVKEAGAVALRGGAFKPRTSPYAFQGHGEQGLELLAMAAEQTGLAVVTEVMRCEHVDMVARYADVLQVGSRNMHHTHLLSAVGRQGKPVLLKRGWSATFDEFLLAAEYIMLEGNHNVILCERGIRTHETYVRNTLALGIVPEVKRVSTLPIIVDPSHGTGRRHLVTPMSYAAVACGADGLIIEVHRTPDLAWTDGSQSLTPEQFSSLMKGLKAFAEAADRHI
ncbi:MAG: 3-deoxy-7-phosphoheptulonate synthase [Phycisphaerae bacterium]